MFCSSVVQACSLNHILFLLPLSSDLLYNFIILITCCRTVYCNVVISSCQCYRAGLYKQLATLKGLVEEYREKPEANQSLRAPIIQNLSQTGLDQDCPFRHASAASATSESELLAPDSAESVSEENFSEYVGQIYQYLQVVTLSTCLMLQTNTMTLYASILWHITAASGKSPKLNKL